MNVGAEFTVSLSAPIGKKKSLQLS
ncbi:Bgt-51839 [Blumeria graminis f. sp. tritici]|uniref:Bgt-51839 n=1 Tax=Blumeria graminis f. sp. tritici TaxID=62690 RepID=A0A9X9L9B8_BLUGR|nr:Bgt-51839 [Blumeria graminis f. sp. tritici]